MVGFGFMDNIIMIQAGDFIDSTLGVTFGISTLTAAALGNVCSDGSGVLFGGIVESASERLNLAQPKLRLEQMSMRSVRLAGTIGALAGVIAGCCLGMCTLLFQDLAATERLKRAQQLETIFDPVMSNCKAMTGSSACTLYLYDDETRELWTKKSSNDLGKHIIKLSLDAEKGLAAHAARTGKLLNIRDANEDPRFDNSWDKKTGMVTRQVLCLPILDADGKLYGVLQCINKVGDEQRFNEDDEKLLKMVATHISIFVESVTGD